MPLIIIITLCLLFPSTALAAQASSTFSVGMVITATPGNPGRQRLAGPQAQASIAEYRRPTDCATRYRSFDPESGTYLGYDGLRHACR